MLQHIPSVKHPIINKAVTIFLYLEHMLLKFSSASLNIIMSKEEILKVTTYSAHITYSAHTTYSAHITIIAS